MSAASSQELSDLESIAALRNRCGGFNSPAAPAHHRLLARAIESLLLQAEQQRPPVRRTLVQRAERHILSLEQQALEQRAPAMVTDTAEVGIQPVRSGQRKPTPIPGMLRALRTALHPAEPVPDKASTGIGFDEYLRLQENEALSAWASEDGALELEDSLQLDVMPASGFAEMKSARMLRELRLRRHADSLVNRALADAPEEPGPLNPEMLSIKALSNMRDLSPQYLNRFVSYIDTMLWLEQALAGSAVKTATAKKVKPRRR